MGWLEGVFAVVGDACKEGRFDDMALWVWGEAEGGGPGSSSFRVDGEGDCHGRLGRVEEGEGAGEGCQCRGRSNAHNVYPCRREGE